MKTTENEIEWEDLPDYGSHMTLERFIDYVKDGMFIPYDGFGYFATADKMSKLRVCFSVTTLNRFVVL
jgi:hypothetical protein